VSIKTSDLKVGDVLHDIHREKMGNTTMSCEGHWEVYVKAVADDGAWAALSWNGNPPKMHIGTVPKGYKRWPKEWYSPGMSGGRQCALCYAKEEAGHDSECEHPRAITARKRAEKAAL
jgi:hypothetical protein